MSLRAGRFHIGANFWSRHAGPRMWSRVDDAALHAELAQAHAIGLDLLRIFAFIPDFVSGEPGRYLVDEARVARIKAFADAAEKIGISLLPSPLVGHMSGENYDLPGAGDRELYSDPALVEGARLLVETVAQALSQCPAVVGYALSNEAPLWGGLHEGKRPLPADILDWAKTMLNAARAAHPGVPMGLGDGLMEGFPHQAIAAHVDFVGPHVYGGDADSLRQGFHFDHALALAARLGRPLLLEEFGSSSAQAGDAQQAELWNEAFFAAFTMGARGAIGWCWSDFPVDTVGRESPYDHHGFELSFGLTRADGSEKPAAGVVTRWRQLIDSLPEASPRTRARDAVIVRSSHLETPYPFSWIDRGACDRAEQTSMVLAGQAGLPPAICDEKELPLDAKLYLVPVTQRLLTSTWLALEERARAGATVYWSYFGGDHAFHQGTWCPIFERLSGCRHRLRYGCFDLPDDELKLEGLLREMAPLPTGAAQVRAGDTAGANPCSFLPIEVVTAKVLAADGQGRPIVVENAVGKGRVIFSAAPLERYAARLVDGTQRGLVHLYRAVAAAAGIADSFNVRSLPQRDSEKLCMREVSVGNTLLVAIMNRGDADVELPERLWSSVRWTSDSRPSRGRTLRAKQVVMFDRSSS